MGAVNLLAGATFAALGGCARRRCCRHRAPAARCRCAARGWASFAAVALLAGFAMMALQTVLIRLGGVAFGASHFTFSMVVAVVRALHRARAPSRSRRCRRIPRLPPAGLLWTPARCCWRSSTRRRTRPTGRTRCASLFRDDARASTRISAMASPACSLVLGVPVALSGAMLPLIFHELRARSASSAPRPAGSTAGTRSARCSARCSAATRCSSGSTSTTSTGSRSARVALAAALLSCAAPVARACGARGDAGGRRSPASRCSRPGRPSRSSSGPSADAARSPARSAGPDGVLRQLTAQAQILLLRRRPDRLGGGQGRSRASMADARHRDHHQRQVRRRDPGRLRTTILLGLVPALLAEQRRARFVIGYGTGVTAGELAALDECAR